MKYKHYERNTLITLKPERLTVCSHENLFRIIVEIKMDCFHNSPPDRRTSLAIVFVYKQHDISGVLRHEIARTSGITILADHKQQTAR